MPLDHSNGIQNRTAYTALEDLLGFHVQRSPS